MIHFINSFASLVFAPGRWARVGEEVRCAERAEQGGLSAGLVSRELAGGAGRCFYGLQVIFGLAMNLLTLRETVRNCGNYTKLHLIY